MYKANYGLTRKDEKSQSTRAVVLFFLSVLIVAGGVLGLIEHKSPQSLASLSTLSLSLIIYFEYHAMIILGALGISYSAWKIHFIN